MFKPTSSRRSPPPRRTTAEAEPRGKTSPWDAFTSSAPALSKVSGPEASAQSPEDPTAALLVQNLGGEHRCASLEETLDFFCRGLAPGSLPYKVMTAAAAGDAGSLASLLARGDVLPDFSNAAGFTPLMAAAVRGQTETAGLLAAHPLVNLGRQNPDGWTALHFAAFAGEDGCVSRLLQHRAPAGMKNRQEKTAFDLATGKTQTAFWENRDFARQMKRKSSGATGATVDSLPETQEEPPAAEIPPSPAPQAAAGGESAAPAKQDTPMKDAFFQALAAASLELKASPRARLKLAAQLASLPGEDFAETFGKIDTAKIAFDWTDVFIAASARGNTRAMWLLHDKFLYDEHTLSYALNAVIDAGGDRSAAHHLLLWGADPDAACEPRGKRGNRTLRDKAFNAHLAGCFEEMVLWPPSPGKGNVFFHYAECVAETGLEDMNDAFRLYQRRCEFKGMRTRPLSETFNRAVEAGDLPRTMAAYAEARQDRLLRGTVTLDKAAGGGAIAVALRRERYDFARLLIAGGFRLADADESLKEELRLLGSKQAKQFAEDHLSGKLKMQSVEDAGLMKKSEQRLHTTGFHGGRFGMWG